MSGLSLTLTAGLLVGFASSLHCAGMCGAIGSALMMAAHPTGGLATRARTLLLSQFGRVLAYAAAGAVVGLFGTRFVGLFDSQAAFHVMRSASAAALIWIGLSTAGLVPSMARLDRVAALAGGTVMRLAGKVITQHRHELPELLLGIGTIYTAAQAEAFVAAGADFIVQPVTTAEVAAVCQAHQLPWLPGALTPNEIYQATQLGAAVVKIFPGNLVGPDYLKALRGPMPEVKLMVTGGVEPTQASLAAWFGAGVDAVGMGSQLFKHADDETAFAALLQQLLRWAK